MRLLVAGALAAAVPFLAAGPVLNPTVIWISEQFHTGGAYTAIQAASDGRVYLGTTAYDGFGTFMVLPAGGREFRAIANTAEMTGEKTPGPYAQAKIHTKPAIAADGKVYFGTKSGEPARDDVRQADYPGGHLLVYDPAADRVTDLGIIERRQSIIAVGVDQTRHLVYALTDPDKHLRVYDPRSRTFSDKGPLAETRAPTRYLVVLANGDAYHAADDEAFTRYVPARNVIERVPLRKSGRGVYETPYALAPSLDGSRFYGVGESTGEVYTFVPDSGAVGVELHGAADVEAPSPRAGRGGRGGRAGRGQGREGGAVRVSHYTITAAPDGNVYYTRNVVGQALFIMRLVTKTGRPEVVGEVGPMTPPPTTLSSRRNADRLIVQGSTATPDGTLYVMLAYPLRVLAFPRLAPRGRQ